MSGKICYVNCEELSVTGFFDILSTAEGHLGMKRGCKESHSDH